MQRLRELGWIEGGIVAIEYRWGDGRIERYAEIAAEFVRLKVVILAGGTEPALAVKQVTSVIPTVFPTSGDPVDAGLVASLARPGDNLTGLSNVGSELGAKRVGLLREMVPGLPRLAVMINANYSGLVNEIGEIEPAARKLGVEILPLPVRGAEDIALAVEGLRGLCHGALCSRRSIRDRMGFASIPLHSLDAWRPRMRCVSMSRRAD